MGPIRRHQEGEIGVGAGASRALLSAPYDAAETVMGVLEPLSNRYGFPQGSVGQTPTYGPFQFATLSVPTSPKPVVPAAGHKPVPVC